MGSLAGSTLPGTAWEHRGHTSPYHLDLMTVVLMSDRGYSAEHLQAEEDCMKTDIAH